jgi:hypothetical protein
MKKLLIGLMLIPALAMAWEATNIIEAVVVRATKQIIVLRPYPGERGKDEPGHQFLVSMMMLWDYPGAVGQWVRQRESLQNYRW